MKAYPTVDDLPDVRTRFSRDAQEVYRAAYNIAYAYDGYDPFVATPSAYKEAKEAFPLSFIAVYFVMCALVITVLRGVGVERQNGRIIDQVIFVAVLIGNQVAMRLLAAKWQKYCWLRREANLLDADGTPTMPGASSPVPPGGLPHNPA
jgi:ABC-type dipeptide/oligopeptide/nickel transport system permease component